MHTWLSLLVFSLLLSTSLGMTSEEKQRLREEVKDMFYHGYNNYISSAFPYDELKSVSCVGFNTWGNNSLTLIDSLDTLLVLGNTTEFVRVTNWIIQNTNFDLDLNVSVFETNIRILGSLLSGHLLISNNYVSVHGYKSQLLDLAADLGKRLLKAFDTPTGIPYGTVNLRNGIPPNESNITCTSGGGTFSLEFGLLSQLTGDPSFEQAAKKATLALWNFRSARNLVGNHINIMNGEWTHRDAGIGHGIDSFYEYLLKSAIYFGDDDYLNIFEPAYEAVVRDLKAGEFYVEVEMNSGGITWAAFNSLQAFWPGLQVLYGDLRNATNTGRMFYLVWAQHGFTPEKLNLFTGRPYPGQQGYPLRPELVESLYYLSRAFPYDSQWHDFGKHIVESIQKHCRTPCGYSGIENIEDLSLNDRMESFFLAETIKYLYLLFDEDNWVDRSNVIFNTEAHIFPMSAKFIQKNQNPVSITKEQPTCPVSKIQWFTRLNYNDDPEIFRICSKFFENNSEKQERKKRSKAKATTTPATQQSPQQTSTTTSTATSDANDVKPSITAEQEKKAKLEGLLEKIRQETSKVQEIYPQMAKSLDAGSIATPQNPFQSKVKPSKSWVKSESVPKSIMDSDEEWQEFKRWKEWKEWQEYQEFLAWKKSKE